MVILALYTRAGYGTQGVFLLFGAAFGVIFQRSRFCLVRAFREPFLTGDGEHTRAAALALVVSTLGFTILKFTYLKDRTEWVFPAAGLGALVPAVDLDEVGNGALLADVPVGLHQHHPRRIVESRAAGFELEQ